MSAPHLLFYNCCVVIVTINNLAVNLAAPDTLDRALRKARCLVEDIKFSGSYTGLAKTSEHMGLPSYCQRKDCEGLFCLLNSVMINERIMESGVIITFA